MEAFPHSRPRFDQPRASLLARAGFARLDPLVLVAGIGIMLFSVYTLGVATKDDFEGDPYYYAVRQAIMEGLHDAAMSPTGTSYPVFGGYPVEIAGKTGTAERPPHGDQSWYVALAPYDDPKYVVAVTVEQGGFGADTAAPATLQILNELLKVNEAKIEQVEADTATYE